MGAVRKLTGAKEAKWAGRDVQKAGQQAVAEYEKAYRDVAPGIAQFMMPQHAAGFGYTPTTYAGGFQPQYFDPETNTVSFEDPATTGATGGGVVAKAFGGMPGGVTVPNKPPPGTITTQTPPQPGQTQIPQPGVSGGMVPGGGEYIPASLQSMDALNRLRAAQGLFGPELQKQFYDEFVSSPGTQFLRDEGIRDINRELAARGGLGGGSRLKAITQFSQNLANQNVGNYMQGLGSLAQTDLSLAGQLAGLRTGLGSNVATGLTDAAIGAADARVAGGQGTGEIIGGLVSAIGSGVSAWMASDYRLKDNLHLVGYHDGLAWYQWQWNEKARELGWDTMPRFGVIAQEIMHDYPDCVVIDTATGYLKVNYGRLFDALSQLDEVA